MKKFFTFRSYAPGLWYVRIGRKVISNYLVTKQDIYL